MLIDNQQPVDKLKREVRLFLPPRRMLLIVGFGMLLIVGFSEGVLADESELESTLQDIANFISIIVVGVAVPNGAYGLFQYMTAGSNVEQDERGRKRLRRTFIALGGIAVIQVAVEAFTSIVGLEAGEIVTIYFEGIDLLATALVVLLA